MWEEEEEEENNAIFLLFVFTLMDLLCGLVVRLPGCRPRGPGFDFRHCQIF
jgi:hypothetical protein